MKDRRKLERFSFEVPAKIDVLAAGEKRKMLDLPTSDICAGGAFFHTVEALPEGTKVKVNMILSLDRLKEMIREDRINVKVNGTVVRSGSQGMAICFDEDYRITPLQGRSH